MGCRFDIHRVCPLGVGPVFSLVGLGWVGVGVGGVGGGGWGSLVGGGVRSGMGEREGAEGWIRWVGWGGVGRWGVGWLWKSGCVGGIFDFFVLPWTPWAWRWFGGLFLPAVVLSSGV